MASQRLEIGRQMSKQDNIEHQKWSSLIIIITKLSIFGAWAASSRSSLKSCSRRNWKLTRAGICSPEKAASRCHLLKMRKEFLNLIRYFKSWKGCRTWKKGTLSSVSIHRWLLSKKNSTINANRKPLFARCSPTVRQRSLNCLNSCSLTTPTIDHLPNNFWKVEYLMTSEQKLIRSPPIKLQLSMTRIPSTSLSTRTLHRKKLKRESFNACSWFWQNPWRSDDFHFIKKQLMEVQLA